VEERLTEEQCWELFQRLFPNGLDDPSLVQKLAPEGWERSPLVLVYHPTAEQVYEETLRFRDNLRRLRGKTAPPEEEPQITFDALRREMPVDASKPAEECADLLGCCLWDVFADNHDVCTAKGALVDLGSFRAAAGFIADFRHRRSHSEAWLNERRDYIDFYLGTWMVRHRADLTPVYELIFRRMQQLGLGWVGSMSTRGSCSWTFARSMRRWRASTFQKRSGTIQRRTTGASEEKRRVMPRWPSSGGTWMRPTMNP